MRHFGLPERSLHDAGSLIVRSKALIVKARRGINAQAEVMKSSMSLNVGMLISDIGGNNAAPWMPNRHARVRPLIGS